MNSRTNKYGNYTVMGKFICFKNLNYISKLDQTMKLNIF